MILFLTQDLMIASAASSHARDAGQKFKFVGSMDRVVHFVKAGIESDDEKKVDLLLVDLQTPDFSLDDFDQASGDVELPNSAAFAQHVNVELLKAARDSKIDQVFTRGQFNGSLAQIITEGLPK